MALKGTLEDLSIVELLQFPYAGRKTGKLIVQQGDNISELYYRDGKLIHAILDDKDGFEATVELVGWDAGFFEFIPDIAPDHTTITIDLHRLVMQALKARDERRFDEERKRVEEKKRKAEEATTKAAQEIAEKTALIQAVAKEATADSTIKPTVPVSNTKPSVPNHPVSEDVDTVALDPELEKLLKKIAQENNYVIYLCVISQEKGGGDTQARLIADYQKGREDDWIFLQVRSSLSALMATYPQLRGATKRILIEDELGIVMLTHLTDTASLIVVTSVGPLLGAVSVKVNKMGLSLADLVAKW
ncbi:MAG: DUF4388 domain-containing protein [Candidatus Electryoneaceae bacterium]|nr:DUF4388 domain-containing protein [Candidatus Electryoneaceae bacterium]